MKKKKVLRSHQRVVLVNNASGEKRLNKLLEQCEESGWFVQDIVSGPAGFLVQLGQMTNEMAHQLQIDAFKQLIEESGVDLNEICDDCGKPLSEHVEAHEEDDGDGEPTGNN
jgi:hypothetical protein